MVVGALETLYVAVRRIQKDYEEGAPRIEPAFFLALLISPVIYSVLSLVVPNAWGVQSPVASYSSLKSVPLLYLIAGALALVVVYLGFDRRRHALEAAYPMPIGIRPIRRRIAALVAMLSTTFLLTWLSFRWPLLCLPTFLGLCFILGFVRRGT